jgi:hypothetical protein
MKQGLIFGIVLSVSGAAWADLPDANKLQNLQKALGDKANEYKMLVNGGGKCLDVSPAVARNNGARIQLWDCNPNEFQRWKNENGRFKNASGKCLDVAGDVKKGGTIIHLWDCNDAPNQKWSFDGGRLRNAGGKCLDVNGDVKKNGAGVQIWDCNDAINQKWSHQLK